MNKNKKAFTLIEVLMVIAIAGIMVAITIAMVNTGQKSEKRLQLEADKLVAVIKEAQNYALTGKKINNQIPCHFVLDFQNATQYRIRMKRKVNNNCILNQFEDFPSYSLGNEIRFFSSSDFYYDVPHAELWSWAGQVNISHKAVVLRAPDNSMLTICVYPGGQVTIKDGNVGC